MAARRGTLLSLLSDRYTSRLQEVITPWLAVEVGFLCSLAVLFVGCF